MRMFTIGFSGRESWEGNHTLEIRRKTSDESSLIALPARRIKGTGVREGAGILVVNHSVSSTQLKKNDRRPHESLLQFAEEISPYAAATGPACHGHSHHQSSLGGEPKTDGAEGFNLNPS